MREVLCFEKIRKFHFFPIPKCVCIFMIAGEPAFHESEEVYPKTLLAPNPKIQGMHGLSDFPLDLIGNTITCE